MKGRCTIANELTLNATLHYEDSNFVEAVHQVVDRLQSVSTKKVVRHSQTIGVTEEAVVLGEVTAPGWALFINRDTVNYIDLKVATGGAIFARLKPDTLANGTGGFAFLELGSGAQAPFAIANTAACLMDYLIVSS